MTRLHAPGAAAVVAAAFSLAAGVSAGVLPVPGPAFMAAVAASGGGRDGSLDEAARLAAVGRYGDSFDALAPGADSLRAGIVASLAGRHETAVLFLRRPSPNPYVERFRLYYAARSLLAGGRLVEALGTIRAIPYPAGTRREHPDRFHARSREVEAAILAECDSLLAAEGVPPDAAQLPGRTRYALGLALLRAGMDSLGAAEIRGACRGSWAPEDRDVLGDALSRCERYHENMAPADLREAARNAMSAGLHGAARRIVDRLLDRNARDYEAMLLRARILREEKRTREAAALCERILALPAPDAAKKEAHRRLAYLEHDLGHRERAVDLCREHADRFGDTGLLPFGARIDISLGRFDRAFATFCGLVRSAPSGADVSIDAAGIQAAAALACVLGREDEAHRLIRTRLSGGDASGGRYEDLGRRASPPILYWLWRTAPDAESKERTLSALIRAHPRSLYAFAARGHIDSLLAVMRATPAADRIGLMAEAERRLVDSLAAAFATDGAPAGGDAHDAYRYFLDCGLTNEAADCVAALGRLGGTANARALAIYREARDRGFHHFAARLLNSPPAHVLPQQSGGRLRYPVAFPNAISAAAFPGIPAELVLAVMREESAFDPNAVSRAGAIGLMQLMPSTARWLGRERGWRGDRCTELRDPACSVAMGSRYLAYLLDRFDGSLVAALAAYNGGEGRMSRWRKQFDPAADPMVAMELIGLRETRLYVGKVLETLCFYYGSAGEREAAER